MIPAKTLPPPPDRAPVRRALLSVSDKGGLVALARRLHALGVEVLSTGGTARTLRAAGLPVTDVAETIGFPEILGGRVKTLHPRVHGGILARRHDPEDTAELDRYGIDPIDLVVVNLYPFREAVARPDVDDGLAAENVDIGGPAMLRAAAKNFAAVAALVDPHDYGPLADELEAQEGTLGLTTRRRLAGKAFAHTAAYDAAVAAYFAGPPAAQPSPEGTALPDDAAEEDEASHRLGEALGEALPRWLTAPPLVLRYGENPHQAARFHAGPASPRVLWGKALSYTNLLDLSAARALLAEFAGAPPTLAIFKHTNPCGVGQAPTLAEAYDKAFATDRQSPFGGIVALNRPLDLDAARRIDAVFTEIVVAPGFEEGVLDFLQQKQNRRLVLDGPAQDDARPAAGLDVRTVAGGLLVQSADAPLPLSDALRARWQTATRREPTPAEWADLDFAWRVAKHVKSNAIVYARDGATLGVGAGQTSRIDASELAVAKAAKAGLSLEGAVVASDAFFPFADGLEAAARAGARAAVQPGGSVRDAEVVAAADARDLAMVLTGTRHFRH